MRRILIANRGEIACRIARTARAMGIETVAVYSSADDGARHVRQADRAVHIGPPAAAESYLDAGRILAAARQSGADAVHPGYGFLSENAEFAAACGGAGLTFIGPTPEAIAAMGDKARAKALMLEAGVPCIPGWHGDDDDEELAGRARELGYPLLIKATAGGGGRGMRVVREHDQFAAALAAARREARSAFGDGSVLIERLVENGAHVEVQVFADGQGNTVHLFERDCSAQRRRQKIIEESPSPLIDDAMRERMGTAAVAAARSIDYVGAGTIEFMVDRQREFYFLEMNTRLQVEHPVTEMVCGIDLVEWQIRIARGEALPLAQHEIRQRGHAVEARIYAEDPAQGFAPQSGELLVAYAPAADGVRYDSGADAGDTVSSWYDPLIGKLIATGRDRAAALDRLHAALAQSAWLGPLTNQRFLMALLDSDAMRSGTLDTAQIDTWAERNAGPFAELGTPAAMHALAALAFAECGDGGWFYSSGHVSLQLDLVARDGTLTCRLQRERDGVWHIAIGENSWQLLLLVQYASSMRVALDGVEETLRAVWRDEELCLAWRGHSCNYCEAPAFGASATQADGNRIEAPVAGVVVSIDTRVGADVGKGSSVAVMEAMKVEMQLVASRAGRVHAVHVKEGQQVAAGTLLVELESED